MNLDKKLTELEQQERIAIANVQRIQGAIAVVRQLQEEQDAEGKGLPAEDTEAKAAVNHRKSK